MKRVWWTLSLVSALGVLVSCGSDDADDDSNGSGGSSGSSAGSTNGSAGTNSNGGSGSSTGGSSSNGGSGSSTGGSSSNGGSDAPGGAAGAGGGGEGGRPACEIASCLRPYECVEECGGPVVYSSCCPCEPPLFDGFLECRGEGGSGG